MSVADLLSRLDKVKPTGKGRWSACCPAHEDKAPSLVVTEAQDGTVLVHCFAGCEVYSIVATLGLELSDLFPPRESQSRPRRNSWNPYDVLRATAHEALVAAVAASRFGQGGDISTEDRERLVTAAARLQRAVELARDA